MYTLTLSPRAARRADTPSARLRRDPAARKDDFDDDLAQLEAEEQARAGERQAAIDAAWATVQSVEQSLATAVAAFRTEVERLAQMADQSPELLNPDLFDTNYLPADAQALNTAISQLFEKLNSARTALGRL